MKTSHLFLFMYLCLVACQNKEPDKKAAVIFLNPDEAGTLKTSDYFNGYRVFTFHDVICNSITDFVEFPDKFLALAETQEGFNRTTMMYGFNLQGDSLYSIGSLGRGPGEYTSAGDEIILNRDSTVMIFDLTKYLNYTFENKLLYEQLYGKKKPGNWGKPVYMLDDTTMIFLKNIPLAGTEKMKEELKKSVDHANILDIYSTRSEKVIHSSFPCKDIVGYYLNNMFYVFQDTMCFYHEKNGNVYNVFQDQTVPRYKVDKGKYNAETTTEEFMTDHIHGITMQCINETDKQVLGIYRFNNRYYYFIHDKQKEETKNFKLVDDDLLKIGIKESKAFPSKYFIFWHNKIQFPNDYLYFFYSPTRYAELIEHIQSQLKEEEWEKYKEEHGDLIKIYKELNENSNTIILGFKFK